MMTTAIIEFLTSGTSNVDGAMLHFDASTFKTSLFEIASTLKTQVKTPILTSLNASPSNAQLVKSGFYELIDVREWHEHVELNIGGKCLPAGNVREWENQLDLNVAYLLYCSHGYQSSIVAQYISARFPQFKIAHLQGGLEAWRELIKE
jgi:rhodanese-related sulfurtransferase